MPKGIVACGKFLKTFGIGGELKFAPYLSEYIDPASLTAGYIVPSSGGETKAVKIASVRTAGKVWIIRPEGVNSPEEATAYTHSELWVDRSLIPDLQEGEYLHQDIIGCKVYDEDDNEQGIIEGILQTGANDVWEIRRPDGQELLIPVIKQVVKSVDIENSKVVVRLLDGLADANAH